MFEDAENDSLQYVVFLAASTEEGRSRRARRPRTRISIRTNQRSGERGDPANATTAAAIDM